MGQVSGPGAKPAGRGGRGPTCVRPWQQQPLPTGAKESKEPGKFQQKYPAALVFARACTPCISIRAGHTLCVSGRLYNLLSASPTDSGWTAALGLPLIPKPLGQCAGSITSRGHHPLDMQDRAGGHSPGYQYSPCRGCTGSQSSSQNLEQKQPTG